MDLNNPNRERPVDFTDQRRPWESLVAAIIGMACKDYMTYALGGRARIRQFFRSDYFNSISSVNPEWLIKALEEKYPGRIAKEFNKNV